MNDEEDVIYATDPNNRGKITTGSNKDYQKEYRNPTWLHYQYHVRKKSINEVADTAGVEPGTILRWMDRHEMPRRSTSEAVKLAKTGSVRPWEDEEWLREQYLDEERSILEIAQAQDVSKNTIWVALKQAGIARRENKQRSEPELEDEDWLFEQYVTNQRSASDIADELGVSNPTVYDALDDAGIERRCSSEGALLKSGEEMAVPKSSTPSPDEDVGSDHKNGTISQSTESGSYEGPATGLDLAWSDASDIDLERWVPYRDKEWLKWMYIEQDLTLEKIAEVCGCTASTIHNWVYKLDIVE